MKPRHVDLAVIGAGFGGALCAWIAAKAGLSTLLIERGRHPRFTLGESSTPLADQTLRRLAARYDLPELAWLSSYSSWKRHLGHLGVGLKRGFTYVHHLLGQPFRPSHTRDNELLFAASNDDESADTHWLRADFDQFMTQRATQAGASYCDQTEITALAPSSPWTLQLRTIAGAQTWTADFVIDAAGGASPLATALKITDHGESLRTRSRCVFGHFRGVRRWEEIYRSAGGDIRQHPFPCDDAALHHLFDGGWMWVLRFDHGVVSAGFSLDPQRHPLAERVPADKEWTQLLEQLPSVAAQFAGAEPLFALRQTGRIQRKFARVAGPNWAMLPTTAGIIDALHSTGNAHTLSGVERLMNILLTTNRDAAIRRALLEKYQQDVLREVDLIDSLVAGCHRSLADFDRFTAYALLYFAAATNTETSVSGMESDDGPAFLLSDSVEFTTLVNAAWERFSAESSDGSDIPWLRRALRPFDRVGLLEPPIHNMHPHTPAVTDKVCNTARAPCPPRPV